MAGFRRDGHNYALYINRHFSSTDTSMETKQCMHERIHYIQKNCKKTFKILAMVGC